MVHNAWMHMLNKPGLF